MIGSSVISAEGKIITHEYYTENDSYTVQMSRNKLEIAAYSVEYSHFIY